MGGFSDFFNTIFGGMAGQTARRSTRSSQSYRRPQKPRSYEQEVTISLQEAYTGSTRDHIEIAVRNGNAAKTLGIQLGDVIKIVGK